MPCPAAQISCDLRHIPSGLLKVSSCWKFFLAGVIMNPATLPKNCAAAPSPCGTAARCIRPLVQVPEPLPTTGVRLTLNLDEW